MEVFFNENIINSNNSKGVYDNILEDISGNQFVNQETIKSIQHEQIKEDFIDWAKEDFQSLYNNESKEADDDEYDSYAVSKYFLKAMDENRESWKKFNKKEEKKAFIQKQIDVIERQQAYEMSLSESIENENKIGALKAQVQRIPED
jgi:hypothetical protein